MEPVERAKDVELGLAEALHSCQLRRLCVDPLRGWCSSQAPGHVSPNRMHFRVHKHPYLPQKHPGKTKWGYSGCHVEMLEDTCAFDVPSVDTDRAAPYWENTRTMLENIPFSLVTATWLLQQLTRSECVCMRGVSGICACGWVSKGNRTIIYSAIWSSRLERQTGICFNYLLLVSAASVTQA